LHGGQGLLLRRLDSILAFVSLFYHRGSGCGIPPSLTTPCYLAGRKSRSAVVGVTRSAQPARSGTKWHIDTGVITEHFATVKHMRPARESKTKGTLIVEQHRPMMNKLSDAERQQLMRAGMELIYGVPAASQPTRRRR
jgi:hypothetical protein